MGGAEFPRNAKGYRRDSLGVSFATLIWIANFMYAR